MFKVLRKKIREDLAIIDSQFPQYNPFGFRNIEINALFDKYSNISSYAMYPMKPGTDAWFKHGYGIEPEEFKNNKNSYLKVYPDNESHIHLLDKAYVYKFKLAYSFFLAETYVLLPFLNKHKIPFIFELYPGGAFGIDNKSSDRMLKEVCSSSKFRGVIVTQKITRDYIYNKKFCPPDKVHYIFGGFSQYNLSHVVEKKKYLVNKKTFDICFVAGKYSDKGKDKGYDVFISVAKILSERYINFRFHIVGGFNENEIDVSKYKERFIFYGYKSPEFLQKLYSGMDISLSPNKPGVLYEGNFDGFPLTLDAMFCGVAAFITDDLDMNNNNFVPNKDIVIINRSVDTIVKKIEYYYNNHKELYRLSERGQSKARAYFNIDYQLGERIKVFKNLVDLKEKI